MKLPELNEIFLFDEFIYSFMRFCTQKGRRSTVHNEKTDSSSKYISMNALITSNFHFWRFVSLSPNS